MIKMQTLLKVALLSSTLPVYANEHAMALLLNDALNSLPSHGVPEMSDILLVQGNDDRKASMHGGRGLGRVLQDMASCNASRIDELYSDPTLNETFTAYVNNFDTSTTFGDCREDGERAIICPVQQTIDGEAEYQSACMAAGGQIEPIPADLSCDTIDTDGSDLSVYVDRPIFLLCSPAASDDFDDACVASARDGVRTRLDAKALLFQQGLVSIGGSATDTSCRITTDEAPASSRSGSADKNGISFVSMAMVVMSLIVGFHYY